MNIKIVMTDDGSNSLYNEEVGDVYHSNHGAINESSFIYIERGLLALNKQRKKLKILEIGFGTGLNGILTYRELEKKDFKIIYDAVEPYPVPFEIINRLNFPTITDYQSILLRMHREVGSIKLSNKFLLNKIQEKIQHINLPSNNYNLVYFDAFSPDLQAELWTKEIFTKIYNSMQKEGLLLTYSAKGQVRRNFRK